MVLWQVKRCVNGNRWMMLFVKLIYLQLHISQASGSNLALGKPAVLSDPHQEWWLASLTVDGSRNNDYHSGSCIHTLENPAHEHWLRIDLLGLYWIQSVIITNRGDCCGERLQAFEIRVSMTEDDTSDGDHGLCYYQEAAVPQGGSPQFFCTKPLWGRYITLSLRPRPGLAERVLSVCEVEVYGGRHPGYDLFVEGSREDCVYSCMMRPGCVAFSWSESCCYMEMSNGTSLIDFATED